MKRLAIRSSLLVTATCALATLGACQNTSVDAQTEDASITTQPLIVQDKSYPLVVREGSTATFTVTAQGAEPVKYQWQRDGVDIAGASDRVFVVAAASLADDMGRYSVRISSKGGDAEMEIGRLLVASKDEPMPWL